MPRIKVVTLLADQRAALEKGAKSGLTPSYRLRCQAVLLKSDPTAPRTSQQVADQIGCGAMSVHDWLGRYEAQGLAGLKTSKGRGRKAILNKETDLEAVRQAVQRNRPCLSLAQAELEQELGREFSTLTRQRFLKKPLPLQARSTSGKASAQCGRANADVYALKKEALAECERLSEQGHVDVFYGDEICVSLQPCVPYAGQFADEKVVMPSEQGGGVNCFAMISRDNRCRARLTRETITAAFVSEELDAFSWTLARPTVVVLDNARVLRNVCKRKRSRSARRCGNTVEATANLYFGNRNLIQYKPGDHYGWSEKKAPQNGGRPEDGSMAGEGYVGECRVCHKDFFVLVTIISDVIVSMKPDLTKTPYIPD